jgi:hypothetical protein
MSSSMWNNTKYITRKNNEKDNLNVYKVLAITILSSAAEAKVDTNKETKSSNLRN